MTSNMSGAATSSQSKRMSLNLHTGSNASILLEKAKAGMRRSTPDSEALASSDDEQDHRHQQQSMATPPGLKAGRRTSWLADTQQVPQRKPSLGTTNPFPTSGNHSGSAGGDQTPWVTNSGTGAGGASRGHPSNTSFPWGSAIWNNDNQKGPPSRLSEVLTSSPTALRPSSSGLSGDEPLLSPPIDSAIPFAIPLHPTPKTYRSQSYSVGQLDPESLGSQTGSNVPQTLQGRGRASNTFSGLQHRPSRPSMLGSDSHDHSYLGQLREVDDDEESLSDSIISGARLPNSAVQAQQIEQLTMENAVLRQQAALQQQVVRSNSMTLPTGARTGSQQSRHSDELIHSQNEVDEESMNYLPYQYVINGRRYSEIGSAQGNQYSLTGIPENRKLESVKRGHWQSSLGFGGLVDVPQSRRHSFADVPTRHGSIGSNAELPGNATGLDANALRDEPHSSLGYGEIPSRSAQTDAGEYARFLSPIRTITEQRMELGNLRNRQFAVAYFSSDPVLRTNELYNRGNSPLQSSYPSQHPYSRSHLQAQPALDQQLCIVTFKALRAEVYYYQEGTGLQVKAGDLVIVEADRGTDLGTVAHHDITWAQAKQLKEKLTEEHYKWLMMFSRSAQGANGSATNPNGTLASTNAMSATGGMGPPGQFTPHDPQSSELKPKMIKRVAQAHEIQSLREKEGNEAKAKRVCQQKVLEHRLNMEILDAEFQMYVLLSVSLRKLLTLNDRDWKKLTFYYFADAYINFNTLVTDLFKIYKTRIWMSAINPASFVTPTVGPQPHGLGNGGIISERERISESRYRKDNMLYNPSSPFGKYDHQAWNASLDGSAGPSPITPSPYGQQYYQSQRYDSQLSTPSLSDYGTLSQQLSTRSHSPFGHQGNVTYGSQQSLYPAGYKSGAAGQLYGNAGSDWQRSFQSLSLGQ